MPSSERSIYIMRKPGGRFEVHMGGTYRIVNPSSEGLFALVKTLRMMRMTDDEIGKVLVCLADENPPFRAATMGLS